MRCYFCTYLAKKEIVGTRDGINSSPTATRPSRAEVEDNFVCNWSVTGEIAVPEALSETNQDPTMPNDIISNHEKHRHRPLI
jgi:hypothetical protein